jgi:maltose alpha-D-glucosyltransferase/alpha-amylase
MKRLLLLGMSMLLCLFISAQQSPSWLTSAVFYQIYPSSFQDSDGDGIGDLAGIQSRLDYVRSIGVNTIWLNPVFKSAFKDGGYDVIDFYQVDPRFGSNTKLVELAKETHAKGMRIVLDLVAGHTSNESPWFQQSMQADKNLQYSDYYIWAPKKPADLSEQEASRWVESTAPRDKYYIKNFFDIQPALNYGYANPNPNHPWEQSVNAPGPQAVRRELENIITFWMEKGLDGFRVDLAASLVKNDPDKRATIALWKELNSWFHKKFPNGVLIAEWFNPKQSIEAGFDIDFLRPGNLTSAFERGKKTNAKVYFDKAGNGNLGSWALYFQDQYNSTLHKGYLSLPTGNHDSPRMANDERNDIASLKVLMTFLLTQPGVPFIYYGDEIGMRYIPNSPDVEGSGPRAGARTPMQWDDSKNAGFSAGSINHLYIPLDTAVNRPTVARQEANSNSILQLVKDLLKLRQSSDALGNVGEWKLLTDTSKSYPMIYLRTDSKNKYLIAINPSDKKIESSIASQNAVNIENIFSATDKCSYTKGKLVDKIVMPPTSAAIFKIE